MNNKWPDRLTSQALCESFGLDVPYSHAAKKARQLVETYNLPYQRIGYVWVLKDNILDVFKEES